MTHPSMQRRLQDVLRPILDGDDAVTIRVVGEEERLVVGAAAREPRAVLSRALSVDVIRALAEGFEPEAEPRAQIGAPSDTLAPSPVGVREAHVLSATGAMPDLETSPETIWSGVIEVDAAMARAWLARNTDNRPLSRTVATRYRRLMGEDRWMVSTDAIGFDSTGKQVNGQHRLTAVAEHCERGGAPIPMLVATGLSPSVFAVLDGGKARSGSDVLHIRGFKYSASVASVVRTIAFAEQGRLWRPSGNVRIELDELVTRAEADREALECAAALAQKITNDGKAAGKVLRPSHAAFAVRAYRLAGQGEAVEAYLQRVATGLGITALDDPAHVVRQAFLDDQRADVAMGAQELLAVLLRGAQHAALGKPMARAKGKGAGAWPSPAVPGWPRQPRPGAAALDDDVEPGTIDNPAVATLAPEA